MRVLFGCYLYGMELSLESLTKNRSNIYLFSNGFSFECYSRFDQSRSHQTLVQMMASLSVVMIVDSTLAQYSEGLKKFGVGSPPTSTEGSPIR